MKRWPFKQLKWGYTLKRIFLSHENPYILKFRQHNHLVKQEMQVAWQKMFSKMGCLHRKMRSAYMSARQRSVPLLIFFLVSFPPIFVRTF